MTNKVKNIYIWISLGTRIIDNRSSVDINFGLEF